MTLCLHFIPFFSCYVLIQIINIIVHTIPYPVLYRYSKHVEEILMTVG